MIEDLEYFRLLLQQIVYFGASDILNCFLPGILIFRVSGFSITISLLRYDFVLLIIVDLFNKDYFFTHCFKIRILFIIELADFELTIIYCALLFIQFFNKKLLIYSCNIFISDLKTNLGNANEDLPSISFSYNLLDVISCLILSFKL